MSPNLKTAIILFLANEFKLEPEAVHPDNDFSIDFNLNKEQLNELITRMQDALDFIIPEEKADQIFTVGDLLHIVEPDSDSHDSL